MKIVFNYDVILTSQHSYDTQDGMVINRAKFDSSPYSSFGGVKTNTHRQTELRSIY